MRSALMRSSPSNFRLQSERRAARAAANVPAEHKVAEVADEFLTRHAAEKNGTRWAAETKRILDRNILPVIGDTTVSSVGKAEIHDMLDAIMDRGTPIAANRTLAVVKKLYRWALSRGYVDRDPCAGITKPGDETKRSQTALQLANLPELPEFCHPGDQVGLPR
jgi:site-specific recombinase XerD